MNLSESNSQEKLSTPKAKQLGKDFIGAKDINKFTGGINKSSILR